MSELNDAKSIAWTRFYLELDTFEEFATAVLQTLAKRCFRHVTNINFKLLNRKHIISFSRIEKSKSKGFNGFYKSINATAIITSCHTPHLELSGCTTLAFLNFI